MTRPMVRIHNAETNEIVDREMTAAEFKTYEANQAKEVIIQAEKEAKATAKAELLAKLGITAEEAALLLG